MLLSQIWAARVLHIARDGYREQSSPACAPYPRKTTSNKRIQVFSGSDPLLKPCFRPLQHPLFLFSASYLSQMVNRYQSKGEDHELCGITSKYHHNDKILLVFFTCYSCQFLPRGHQVCNMLPALLSISDRSWSGSRNTYRMKKMC